MILKKNFNFLISYTNIEIGLNSYLLIYRKGNNMNSKIYTDYNEIIKKLRVQNFYTQQEIADLLNICQRTYADYELRKLTNFNRKFNKTCTVLQCRYELYNRC